MPDELAKDLCWYCNEETGMGHFCNHCVKLQPLPDKQDYFSFIGLERKMRLDPKKLEETFYALSRKFHPDFYQDKSDKEKALGSSCKRRRLRLFTVSGSMGWENVRAILPVAGNVALEVGCTLRI